MVIAPRHAAMSDIPTTHVAHSDNYFACHSRRGDSADRLFLDSLVALHPAKPPRLGGIALVRALEDAGVVFLDRTKTRGPGECLKG